MRRMIDLKKVWLVAVMAMAVAAIAGVNITEDTVLDADADWRSQGTVTVANGVTLNLNGHNLAVKGLDCQGSIIPYSATGYRYYRFKVDALASGRELQISEIKLFSGDRDITQQRHAVLWRKDNYTANYYPTFVPEVALDNNTGTKWFDDRNLDDVWVTLEYAQPVVVTHYQWFNGNDTNNRPGRRPTAWRFQGSNDNSTWDDLDVVTDANCTSGNYALAYSGSVNVPTEVTGVNEFKFFRFKVDAVRDPSADAVQICEIKLYSNDTDITGQRSGLQWKTENFSTAHGSYKPEKAFDWLFGNSEWFDTRINGADTRDDVWVTVAYASPVLVTKYQWWTGYDTITQWRRNPTAWRLQGSNDNENWTDLEVVSGAVCTTESQTLAYTGYVNIPKGLKIDITDGAQYRMSGTCTAPVTVLGCRLAADADLRCFGDNLNIRGNVDLAGHRLTVAGLAGDGVISSAEPAGDPPSYKFFRFKVDATKGGPLQISEVKLFAGNTDITRTYSAFHWNQDTFPSKYLNANSPLKAVDNNLGTKWFDDERLREDCWFTLEYAQPQQVTRYQWFTGDDTERCQNRNASSWCLMGSNDNVNWTDLEGRVGVTPTVANKALAYTGYVEAGDGSELRFEVPEGQTRTHSAVTLDRRVKLVKTGGGTLIAARSGNTHHGGTVVTAGILKPGVKQDASIFGAAGSMLVIEEGTQFLDDIQCLGSTAGVNWLIAGEGPDGSGAIKTTVGDNGNQTTAWGRGLYLADDALILRDEYAFDFEAIEFNTFRLGLNGHTLNLGATKYSPWFLVCSVLAPDEGTLVIGDNINFAPYKNFASSFPNATLVVSPGAFYNSGNSGEDAWSRAVTVSNFVYRSNSEISQMSEPTYVLGCYTPASIDSAPKVVLGDAEHLNVALDLSERSTPFDMDFGGGMSFAENAVVEVRLGARRCRTGECLVAWTEKPSVKFLSTNSLTHFEVQAQGLFIARGTIVFIR